MITRVRRFILPLVALPLLLCTALTVGALAAGARAQTLSGAALVGALRLGGYVLIMCHPSSPLATPDKAAAAPGNVNLERQLDAMGRRTVRAMGAALRKLHIPIGEVLSSPTYRTLEAVRLARFGKPQTFAELGEGAEGMMSSGADPARSAWLRARAAMTPRAGTNTIIVTHTPNLKGAFGVHAAGVAAGETLVFHPDGKGGADFLGRIKIEEWPRLAAGS